MEEKRVRGDRVRKFIDLTVEDGAISNVFRASTADISASGMRLVTTENLARGSSYTFTLKRAPHLMLRGEVRWVEALGNEGYRAGVHFVQNPPDVATTLGAFVEAELNRPGSPP